MKKYLLVLLFLSIACERKEVRINDESDSKYAKELATKFYKELSNLDTLKIYNYLDISIPKKDLHKLIVKNNKDFGNITKVDIINVSTNYTNINEAVEVKYDIKNLVIYEKVKCEETISFIKKDKKDVKLEGYLTKEILE
jgi:hypothetical protein